MYVSSLSKEEAEILQYAFSQIPGVKNVTVYRATGGCALEYDGKAEPILERLGRFRLANVEMLASEEDSRISAEEMRSRKLDPKLKQRLRLRMLAETAADIVLPMPVQVGYHVWQMITLKNL